MTNKIKEIVLTGGPCAGKTTGKNYLAEKLRDWGFRVFVMPEVATMLIISGITDIAKLKKGGARRYLEIERQVLLLQMALRRRFFETAKIFSNEKRIILYDRGPMDVKAYAGKSNFEAITSELRLNFYDLRDSFDGIIHLVTAAKGAEKFYTIANNEARYESLEEARLSDERTLQAWLGHPRLRIIDNSTGFEQKMRRALQAVSRMLDIPAPLEIERKFLLAKTPNLSAKELKRAQKISIEQIYLRSPSDEETRIRQRSQNDFSVYYLAHKTQVSSGVRQEREEEIKAIDYFRLQKQQIPNSRVIRKNRYCFVYNNQYFELDIFINPPGIYLLEIELTQENDFLDLPPFLKIAKEVTDDPTYSNYALATT